MGVPEDRAGGGDNGGTGQGVVVQWQDQILIQC